MTARFVIQQHDATTVHYDFRLEVDGVLRSWAVPRGPSTNPREKRLAVEVEDHQLAYADFEGTIGSGRATGAVIVWDTGVYRNLDADRTMSETIESGHVKVWLEGEKLRGGWTLQRTRRGDKPQWLMIKRRDDEPGAKAPRPPTDAHSVRTGRTLAEVAAGQSTIIRVGRRAVAISHPDKALFQSPEITKLTLARYYEQMAEVMLPHLRDRPLALQVFPQGVDAHGFFLKAVPGHFPDWIATVEVPKRGGSLRQALAENGATLVYLAGQNVVTPHVWLSRADDLRRPDRLIIDLDPAPGVRFAEVRAAAREVGQRLRDAGLASFAMLTGSRGVHVVSPLRRGPTFTETHGFARAIAEAMVADNPRHLTLQWRRDDRGRRIYLDVNRINYAQHVVAPYSVRPLPRGPVAMPIEWDELSDRACKPDRYTVRTAAERVLSQGDAWRMINRRARKLPVAA